MQDLETLGGVYSTATAMNNKGQVTGWAYLAGAQAVHAFRWTASKGIQDLGALTASGNSFGAVMNDAGDVAGTASLGIGVEHAFLWTPAGGMQDLGSLGGTEIWVTGINRLGDLIGYGYTARDASGNFTTLAFLWTPSGGMQTLGTLGGQASLAYAINNKGDVTGESQTAAGYHHAFLWTRTGGMTDLGTPSGLVDSFGQAINNRGEVTGYAGQNVLGTGTNHAFRWTRSGGMQV